MKRRTDAGASPPPNEENEIREDAAGDSTALQEIADYPVMRAPCATCPFRADRRGRHPDPKLVEKILGRTLSQASQICHHPTLSGKEQTHLCRGARDFQIAMFHRLGVLDAPTEEAWERRRQALEKDAP